MTDKKFKAWTRLADNDMKDYGEIDYRLKVMRVNPGKGDVVDTAIHEELHRLHPNWTEKHIRKMARSKAKNMSINQMANMLKRYRTKRRGKKKRTTHYKTD